MRGGNPSQWMSLAEVHVGLQVDHQRQGNDLAHPRLQSVDGGGDLNRPELGIELDLGCDEQLVGSEVECAQVDQSPNLRPRLDGPANRGHVSRRRPLADQEALHLAGQNRGDCTEQPADGDRRQGVVARVVDSKRESCERSE